jgi:hypothetical protein
MATPRETFQSLLRELFQFDLADLDFGIYRLFRLKKDELDKFINEQIPQAVEKAFADLAEGDTGKLKAEVADLAQKIREELEVDAILDDGSLNPRYNKAAIGKTVRLMVNDYEEKFKRLRASAGHAEPEGRRLQPSPRFLLPLLRPRRLHAPALLRRAPALRRAL